MPSYQTYQRIDIHSRIGNAYSGMTYIIICFLPVYLILTNGHLEDEEPRGVHFATASNPAGFSSNLCSERVMAAGGNCTVWDWLESIESNPDFFFISTFVEDHLERRNCGRKSAPCGASEIYTEVSKTAYYVAGTEKLHMNIEHRGVCSIVSLSCCLRLVTLNLVQFVCAVYRFFTQNFRVILGHTIRLHRQ
jgi:hypothetical protein